ncbi:vanillyl-alcohol oxidase, partial [Alternaria burnsii]
MIFAIASFTSTLTSAIWSTILHHQSSKNCRVPTFLSEYNNKYTSLDVIIEALVNINGAEVFNKGFCIADQGDYLRASAVGDEGIPTNAIELFVFVPEESERMDRLYRDLLNNAYARGITEYRTHVDYMDMVQSHYEGLFNQFLNTLEIRLDPHDILSPGKSSIWG